MVTVKGTSTRVCGELGLQASRRKAVDDATLDQVVRFHGHLCPGLSMGIHAAHIAVHEIRLTVLRCSPGRQLTHAVTSSVGRA